MMNHLQSPALNGRQQPFWALIREINNCWYQGRPADLSEFFQDEIVFNSPDFQDQLSGKAACIRSYQDFIRGADMISYQERSPTVQVFAQSAIVTYHFEMKYRQNEITRQETGTDIFVFEKRATDWKAVWRAVTNLKNN